MENVSVRWPRLTATAKSAESPVWLSRPCCGCPSSSITGVELFTVATRLYVDVSPSPEGGL